MVIDDLINTDDKPSVLRSLLLRHRHVNEHQSGFPFTKRKYNSYTSLQVSFWISLLLLSTYFFFFILFLFRNSYFNYDHEQS